MFPFPSRSLHFLTRSQRRWSSGGVEAASAGPAWGVNMPRIRFSWTPKLVFDIPKILFLLFFSCQLLHFTTAQENAPFSTEVAFATILEDLNHTGPLVPGGMTLKGDPAGPPLFASITEQPVAAASLGQVYKATTLDGQTVAVKAGTAWDMGHGTWEVSPKPTLQQWPPTMVFVCHDEFWIFCIGFTHYAIMINYDQLWWIMINYDQLRLWFLHVLSRCFVLQLWHTIGPHQEIQKGAEAFSGRLASTFLCHPRCSDLVAWSRRRCCDTVDVLQFCPNSHSVPSVCSV